MNAFQLLIGTSDDQIATVYDHNSFIGQKSRCHSIRRPRLSLNILFLLPRLMQLLTNYSRFFNLNKDLNSLSVDSLAPQTESDVTNRLFIVNWVICFAGLTHLSPTVKKYFNIFMPLMLIFLQISGNFTTEIVFFFKFSSPLKAHL